MKKRRMKKEQAEDEALEDKLEAEVDALLTIGRLTSRQEALLSAVLLERVEVMERMKRRRATMKKRKNVKKRKLPKSSSCRAVRTWKAGRSTTSPLPSCPCSVSSWYSVDTRAPSVHGASRRLPRSSHLDLDIISTAPCS